MIAFIDDHRGAHGIEPICKVLPVAPSTYHAHATKRADPAKLSARAKRDAALRPEIARVFAETALNTRLRKTLDWRTPAEALDELLRSTNKKLVTTTA